MKPRPPTPPAGTVAVSPLLASGARLPLPLTVRAKTHDALMSATAKTVAALQFDNHSEPVLVVYRQNAASVFFEQAATHPKAGLLR